KQHLREVLLHYYLLKKSAAETCRLLVNVYGDHAPSKTTCRYWFQCFKSGDFDVNDKERDGAPKKFQNEELEKLLDIDPCQTLEELSAALDVDRSTVGK
ncbi:Histone-lysine N-methyltransferase SETMAR, partial [Harpegnathos saltator]